LEPHADDRQGDEPERAEVVVEADFGEDRDERRGADQRREHDNRPIGQQQRGDQADRAADDGRDQRRLLPAGLLDDFQGDPRSGEQSDQGEGGPFEKDGDHRPQHARRERRQQDHPLLLVPQQRAGQLRAQQKADAADQQPKQPPPPEQDHQPHQEIENRDRFDVHRRPPPSKSANPSIRLRPPCKSGAMPARSPGVATKTQFSPRFWHFRRRRPLAPSEKRAETPLEDFKTAVRKGSGSRQNYGEMAQKAGSLATYATVFTHLGQPIIRGV
jgi:hypothetical protein